MNIVLFVIVLVLLLGGLPHWNIHQLGYGPSSLGALLLIVLIVLLLSGRL